jgi:hypothetical protein
MKKFPAFAWELKRKENCKTKTRLAVLQNSEMVCVTLLNTQTLTHFVLGGRNSVAAVLSLGREDLARISPIFVVTKMFQN